MNKIACDIELNNCLQTKKNDVRKTSVIVTFISQLIKSGVDVHVKKFKGHHQQQKQQQLLDPKQKKIPKQFGENAMKTIE